MCILPVCRRHVLLTDNASRSFMSLRFSAESHPHASGPHFRASHARWLEVQGGSPSKPGAMGSQMITEGHQNLHLCPPVTRRLANRPTCLSKGRQDASCTCLDMQRVPWGEEILPGHGKKTPPIAGTIMAGQKCGSRPTRLPIVKPWPAAEEKKPKYNTTRCRTLQLGRSS